MRRPRGFTLIELLVVIAIVSIIGSILVPVFSQARGKSYQAACMGNAAQLGQAIELYTQDYDERVPNGQSLPSVDKIWAGEGWAGQCAVYVKSAGLFHCSADRTSVSGAETACSYGYNYNLTQPTSLSDSDQPRGVSLADLSSPSHTVMLFEVSGVTTLLPDPREGMESSHPAKYLSASSNGLDNRLYAKKDFSTSVSNQYATGYLGGRKPFNLAATQFNAAEGRHHGGSTFLLSDGHTKWLVGSAVSSGRNALQETCGQDNADSVPGCGGRFNAAGTASSMLSATFSIR